MPFRFGSSSNPRLQQLKNMILFKDLTFRELEVISNLLHERHYIAGEVIFDEGEEGHGLFVVYSGRIQTSRQGALPGATLEFGAGSFLGEIALLNESLRTAQARAAEDTTVLALFRADFFALLNTHSNIASRISFQLARVLATRLRTAITVNAQHLASA